MQISYLVNAYYYTTNEKIATQLSSFCLRKTSAVYLQTHTMRKKLIKLENGIRVELKSS